ncbi:MAG: hypothetical protein EOP84_31700, partial [Verrucomicrobiaceae bacterium]
MRERYFILAETARSAPHGEPVKIALLHYSAAPVIGGVERVLEQHARLLSGGGHEVTIICGTGAQTENTPEAPVRLVLLPELAASHPRVKLAQTEITLENSDTEYTSLRDFLLEELRSLVGGCDVVFLHNVCTMPFHVALTEGLWLLSADLPRTRFICWLHDLAAVNPDYRIPQGLPWDLLRRANERFEYVAVSDLRQRQMAELTGLPPERCTVIPNALDLIKELDLTPQIEHLTKSLNLLEADVVLLQPTRLLSRKNVELSIHVTAALNGEAIRACLLVTGAPDPHNSASASYGEHLLSLRKQHGLHDA